MDPCLPLAGCAALVTGSSQGIGLAIALGLQTAGARIVFHGKPADPPPQPALAPYLPEDLLAPHGAARLVESAFAVDESINLLVCNAGGFFDLPFLAMDLERWDRTINLNVRAAYFTAQAFARSLDRRHRAGAILLTCSTNSFQSEEDSTAYDTSKGALAMLTRSLAHSLASRRIRVNGIAPGMIRTPLSDAFLAPARQQHYEKKILLGRLGEPADCAGAAVFLLSAAAGYITGQILVIDGGLTVGQLGRP